MFGKTTKRKCSDALILEGLRQKQGSLFEQAISCLYGTCRDKVMSQLRSKGASEADVEDVFQDAIIALLRNIQEKNAEITTTTCGFLYIIARNIWFNRLRKESKTEPFISADKEVALTEPDTPVADPPFDAILEECRQQLSQRARDVIDDYIAGLNMDEIAQKRGYKNAQVARQTKLRALKELTDCAQSKS